MYDVDHDCHVLAGMLADAYARLETERTVRNYWYEECESLKKRIEELENGSTDA